MKDLMQKIADTKGITSSHYNLKTGQLVEIKANSNCQLSTALNIFAFGYMQGMKAAKAETKRKKVISSRQP